MSQATMSKQHIYEPLSQLSAKQLYLTINSLKRQNNCLLTNNIRLELLANHYGRLCAHLDTTGHFPDDDYVRRLRQQIYQLVDLNANQCIVDTNGCHNGYTIAVLPQNTEDIEFGKDDYNDHNYDDNDNGMGFIGDSDVKSMNSESAQDIVDENDGKTVCKRPKSKPNRRSKKTQMAKTYLCGTDGCKRLFHTHYQLESHERRGDHQFGRTLHCRYDGCTYQTTSKQQFSNHVSLHSAIVMAPVGDDLDDQQMDTHLNQNSIESNTDNEEDSDYNDSSNVNQDKDVDKSVKIYVCKYKDCGQHFSQLTSHRQHMKAHTGHRFYCNYDGCCKHYSNRRALNHHKAVGNHVLGQPFKCGLKGCIFVTESKQVLEQHIAGHPSGDHGNGDNHTVDDMFACDWLGCDQRFANKKQLLRHKVSHRGPYKCDVDGCRVSLSTPESLNNHLVGVHGTTYKCQHCQYTTGLKSTFNYHLMSHSTERQFNCSMGDCDKTFREVSELKHHQLVVHPEHLTDIPWIDCTYTDCQFKTKVSSKLHKHSLRAHTGQSAPCGHCGKVFANELTAQEHKKWHQIKWRYSCDWHECERRFPSQYRLNIHMNQHMGQSPYGCDWPGCDKSYFSNDVLAAHRRVKHPAKPKQHPCHWPGCDKKYLNVLGLKTHIDRLHKGKFSYRCYWPDCGYTPTNSINLNNHFIKRHHISDRTRCPYGDCSYHCEHPNDLNNHMKAH